MRIVICDDHKLLLEALASALAGCGITVEATVDSPADAVRAVALNAPDLLLIDLCFPRGSGLDAAREVMANYHPRTKVVVMTASEEAEPLMQALAIGVSGYVAKDRPIDALARSLEEVAAGATVIERNLLRAAPRARQPATGPQMAMRSLTTTERRVLHLMAEGMSTGDIVGALQVTQSTVRTHIQNIFTKLDVHSRLQAVALLAEGAIREGHAVRT